MALTRLVGVDADSCNIQIREKNNTHVIENKHQATAPSPLHYQGPWCAHALQQNIDIMDQVMLSPDGSDYTHCKFNRKFEETLAYHSPNMKPVQLAGIVVC